MPGGAHAQAEGRRDDRAPPALTTHGLPKRSWVKISQIRVLAAERIGRRLARASAEEVARVVEGLDEIIG